uniref:Uncharacterized protein n=1 Tax=Rhizophora mucronata TaxID=61149 RepID=A0A2P2QH98_RHIMU
MVELKSSFREYLAHLGRILIGVDQKHESSQRDQEMNVSCRSQRHHF